MHIFWSVLTGIGFVLVLCVAGVVRVVLSVPKPAEGGLVGWDPSGIYSSPRFWVFILAAFVTGYLWKYLFSIG